MAKVRSWVGLGVVAVPGKIERRAADEVKTDQPDAERVLSGEKRR
jgi:hypothetical protein